MRARRFHGVGETYFRLVDDDFEDLDGHNLSASSFLDLEANTLHHVDRSETADVRRERLRVVVEINQVAGGLTAPVRGTLRERLDVASVTAGCGHVHREGHG